MVDIMGVPLNLGDLVVPVYNQKVRVEPKYFGLLQSQNKMCRIYYNNSGLEVMSAEICDNFLSMEPFLQFNSELVEYKQVLINKWRREYITKPQVEQQEVGRIYDFGNGKVKVPFIYIAEYQMKLTDKKEIEEVGTDTLPIYIYYRYSAVASRLYASLMHKEPGKVTKKTQEYLENHGNLLQIDVKNNPITESVIATFDSYIFGYQYKDRYQKHTPWVVNGRNAMLSFYPMGVPSDIGLSFKINNQVDSMQTKIGFSSVTIRLKSH